MSIIKSFSERERERLGQVPDVFTYGQVPSPLRVQIEKIWQRFFGSNNAKGPSYTINPGWQTFRREAEEMLGVHNLNPKTGSDDFAVTEYFRVVANDEAALDLIHLFAIVATRIEGRYGRQMSFNGSGTAVVAIGEINSRLRQHGLGYEIVAAKGAEPYLIKKDSEHLHQEVVIPALRLLQDHAFAGASDEYRIAHRHHLEGSYRDCITNCENAFESTMKTICNRRNWIYQPDDRAKGLIKACLDNGLLPGFLESHLSTIRTGLGDGGPVVRNRMGSHGQGEEVKEVPEMFSAYMLHETAVNIVLLVEAFKALPLLT